MRREQAARLVSDSIDAEIAREAQARHAACRGKELRLLLLGKYIQLFVISTYSFQARPSRASQRCLSNSRCFMRLILSMPSVLHGAGLSFSTVGTALWSGSD